MLYKLHKSQPPNVRGRHQTVCNNWKGTGNPDTMSIYSGDTEMEFGIEKSAMLIMWS